MLSSLSSLPGLVASRRMNASMAAMNTSLERLATGKRINRAADDPAGLQALDPIKAEIQGLKSELKSLDDEDYRYGALEGALSVLGDQLLELQGLVQTAANRVAVPAKERQSLQLQAEEILKAIDFLAEGTRFRGEKVIEAYSSRKLGSGTGEVRDESGQTGSFTGTIAAIRDKFNLVDGNVEAADKAVASAIEQVASLRAAAGAMSKNNDSRRKAAFTQLENLSAAQSLIEDADYAKETAALVRAQMLSQVGAFITRLTGQSQRDTVLQLIAPRATG